MNTIVVDGGVLVGYNTDVGGFVAALQETVSEPLAGASALVLGAGGAARAAVLGLLRVGVRRCTVVNRTVSHAEEAPPPCCSPPTRARVSSLVALDALTAAQVRGADIVVNATALGMAGSLKVPRVLVDNIQRDHIVYDVVYGQRPTMPLERARETGARAIDGLTMLVWQAALSLPNRGRAGPRHWK